MFSIGRAPIDQLEAQWADPFRQDWPVSRRVLPEGVPRQRRILLAYGDIGVQATLAVALRERVVLTEACSVAEAVHLLTLRVPDLLILSTRQPDLDAVALIRLLRAKAASCPVLVLSDEEHLDAVGDVLDLGIDSYFLKPLAFDRLLSRIWLIADPALRPVAAFDGLRAHVSRAIQDVSCQAARVPSVGELARVVGVSVSHLTHGFSLDTAMSSKEYLTRVRIEYAKRLLARTPGKLETIAAQLGFSDASHLSRVFRARTGQSPGRFRRARRGSLESW